MSDQHPSDPFAPGTSSPRRGGAFFGVSSDGKTRWERRKDRIRDEIERNRAGDFKIPTWALTVLLVAIVVGFGLFIAFA